MRGDHLDVEVLVADVGAKEFASAHRGKRRKRRDKGDESGFRHARGHAEQVLFGDAEIEEAFREPLAEGADLGGFGEIGAEADDFGVPFAQFGEHESVDFALGEFVRVVHGPGQSAFGGAHAMRSNDALAFARSSPPSPP